jgi:hypothetical protein
MSQPPVPPPRLPARTPATPLPPIWHHLPAESQRQLAQVVADLLRRRRQTHQAEGTNHDQHPER